MEDNQNTFLRSVITFLKVIVIALMINLLIKGFLIRTYTVDSSSMQETLKVNDKVITEVISGYFSKPAQGDVIVFVYPETNIVTSEQKIRKNSVQYVSSLLKSFSAFQWPTDTEVEYVKRVIGLPGDIVDIRDNKVYVNDLEVEEGYIANNVFTNTSGSILEFPFEVPNRQYFVMGDNRENSFDSRYWGTVPEENIIGRAILVFYPFRNAKAL